MSQRIPTWFTWWILIQKLLLKLLHWFRFIGLVHFVITRLPDDVIERALYLVHHEVVLSLLWTLDAVRNGDWTHDGTRPCFRRWVVLVSLRVINPEGRDVRMGSRSCGRGSERARGRSGGPSLDDWTSAKALSVKRNVQKNIIVLLYTVISALYNICTISI